MAGIDDSKKYADLSHQDYHVMQCEVEEKFYQKMNFNGTVYKSLGRAFDDMGKKLKVNNTSTDYMISKLEHIDGMILDEINCWKTKLNNEASYLSDLSVKDIERLSEAIEAKK